MTAVVQLRFELQFAVGRSADRQPLFEQQLVVVLQELAERHNLGQTAVVIAVCYQSAVVQPIVVIAVSVF